MNTNYHENTAFERERENSLDNDNNTTTTEAEVELQKQNEPIDTTLNRQDVDGYVMYKRRWFGMLAIFMLNLSTGLVWLTFNAVPDISAEWLHTGKSHVNLTVSTILIGGKQISYPISQTKYCIELHSLQNHQKICFSPLLSFFSFHFLLYIHCTASRNILRQVFSLQVILYFVAYIIMSSVSGFVFEKWGIKKAVSRQEFHM